MVLMKSTYFVNVLLLCIMSENHVNSFSVNTYANNQQLARRNTRLNYVDSSNTEGATTTTTSSSWVSNIRNNNVFSSDNKKQITEEIISSSPPTTPSSSVTELSGFDQLGSLVDNAEKNAINVIFFHASYCKACKTVMPRYKRIAKKESSKDNNIKFSSIESSKLGIKNLNKIGVERLPTIQVWINGQRMDIIRAAGFQTKLRSCIQRTEEEWEEFKNEHSKSISDSVQALLELRKQQSPSTPSLAF